jgi:hypothetical protein
MLYLTLLVFFFTAFCLTARLRAGHPLPVSGLLLFDGGDPGDDDSDMKIAGAAPAAEEPDDAEKELERHRLSGNLDKAYALATELAEKIINEDGDISFGSDPGESAEIRMQRRLLLAFTVTYSVEMIIKSRILGQVVINHLYDGLKRDVPDFYEDIRESGSFSFYYLCIRKGGSVDQCIGRSFAMLTGCEDDPVMEDLGEALFFHFKDIVENAINACGFTGVALTEDFKED